MAALKQQTHPRVIELPQDFPQTTRKSTAVRKQPLLRMESVLNALPNFAILVSIFLLAVIMISNYAEINRLQVAIFDAQQEVNSYRKQIDTININQNATFSMNELKEFATTELGMVVASDKNEIVITVNEQFILDKNVGFKKSPEPKMVQVAKGN